jgi:hypothetical protein
LLLAAVQTSAAEARQPRASTMDFEDGKRRLWLGTAADGRRGGLRRGSVYHLKMAVWALFCRAQAARMPAPNLESAP